MLVLTRKVGERIVIDDNIVVEVLQVVGNRVRLGIQAPAGVTILRQELVGAEAPTTAEAGPGGGRSLAAR
jgi:carbon storage regulator